MMTKFKVDENLPIEVAELLGSAGHDAITTFDQNMVGVHDANVASVYKAEDRVLITLDLDLDFSDIRTYPPADYPGIIVLRPQGQAKPTVMGLVGRMIVLLKTEEPLRGHLWIVQETRLRIR